MGDTEKKNEKPTAFTSASMRLIAETCSIGNLPEDACHYLADEVTFKTKFLIQEAQKFMLHSKRCKLLKSDMESVFKAKGLEPPYGSHQSASLPLQSVTAAGNKRIYYHEFPELDLADIAASDLSKVPQRTAVKAHWLAIDGRQPAVPENPPPRESAESAVGAGTNMSLGQTTDQVRPKSLWELTAKSAGRKSKGPDLVKFKDVSTHELSVEQQMFFREISEACVGSQEDRRTEALASLANDSGLHQVLPRLVVFIIEGVRVNVLNNNLALLIYLMRMVAFLLSNTHIQVQLEKYLHLLVPNILSCCLGKQLCSRPETDNHWALRDFAAKQLGVITSRYSTPSNNLRARICQVVTDSMKRSATGLTTVYGCVVCLIEQGQDTIVTVLLPLLPSLSDRLLGADSYSSSRTGELGAAPIKKRLLDQIPPVLRLVRSLPDSVDEYLSEFGMLGPELCTAVQTLRMKLQHGGSVSSGHRSSHHYVSNSSNKPKQQLIIS